jgi:hypothetical protein
MAHGSRALADSGESSDLALIAAHAVGGIVGGALGIGALAALVSIPLAMVGTAVGMALIIVVGATAIVADLQLITLPFNHRQVRASLMRTIVPAAAMFRYGLVLGSGLLTYLPYAAIATVATWAAAGWGAPAAVGAGAAFGFGRTAAVPALQVVSRHLDGLAQAYGPGRSLFGRASATLSAVVVLLAAFQPRGS